MKFQKNLIHFAQHLFYIYISVYYKVRVIYKNIESCCTKNSNLKKKSNLSCNSLKFKSITQDENNACKIRACEVFVFVCGVKISFRKKKLFVSFTSRHSYM